MSFRNVTRLFVLGAVLFLVAAGGLTLYATGYITQLRVQTLAPESAASIRADLIDEIERVLGPRGASGALREYGLTRTPRLIDATGKYLGTARQVIGLYTDQAKTRPLRQGASELTGILEKVTSLHTNAADLDPTILAGRLEATSAQLMSLTDALRQAEVRYQFNGARRVGELLQGTVIFCFIGSFVALLSAAVLLRSRIVGPLETIINDLEDLATLAENGSDAEAPIWGLERSDEIGDMARALQRLRETQSQSRSPLVSTEGGPLKLELSGPSGTVMEEVLESVRQATTVLIEKGNSLDTAREEAASRAVEEVSRLASSVSEVDSGRRKIEEIVAAQRKELGATRTDLRQLVEQIGQEAAQLQARFEDVVGTFKSRTDAFGGTTEALGGLTQKAEARLTEVTTRIERSHDAVTNLLTDAETIGDTTRTAAEALKVQFTEALEDVRAAYDRLGETAASVEGQAAHVKASVESHQLSIDETYKELSERLDAAADAIEVMVGQLATAAMNGPAPEGEAPSPHQGVNLSGFGETVAEGLRQISRSLEQGNARTESMAHDLTRMRTALDGLSKGDAQTEGAAQAINDLTQAARAQADDLARMRGLLESLPKSTGSEGGYDLAELTEAVTVQTGNLAIALESLKGLETAVQDVGERIDHLQGSDTPSDRAEPGDIADLQAQVQTVINALGAVTEGLQSLPVLTRKIDDLVSDGSSLSGDTGGLNTLHTKIEELASGIADGLTEVIAQVGRAVDEQGVTAASVSRGQQDLRGILDSLSDRVDAVATALAAMDSDATGTVADQPGAVAAEKERMEAAVAQFKTLLEDQTARLEAGTTGLTQAVGANLARADDIAERLGVLETNADGFRDALARGLKDLEDRSDGLGEGMRDTISRIDTRMAALAAALDTPRTDDTQQTAIPVDDLRVCIEEILTPFAQGNGEDGVEPGVGTALLQDVVLKLGALAEKVEGQRGEDDPSTTAYLSALESAVIDLRKDLESRLDGLRQEMDRLRQNPPETPIVDAEALASLTQRIEAEARNVLERLSTDAVQSREVSEPVIHSLTEFVRLLKEKDLIEPEQDSFTNATADIDAVTDVIDVLERRSALLARRIMDGGDLSETGDDEVVLRDPESAISRLQAAGEKLGNIATAIAIASDAHRLHAAG